MIRDLFNVPVIVNRPMFDAPRDLGPDGGSPPSVEPIVQREGAFVTPQSLVTFAGSTSIVTLLAKIAVTLRPSWGGSPMLIAVISLIVGIAVYLINETDPLKPPANGPRSRVLAIVFALLNTCVIFSASIGADSMVGKPVAGQSHVEVTEGNHV